MTDRQTVLRLWMQTAAGKRLLRDVRPTLDELVRRLHGDTLLWCGDHVPSLRALQRSIVRHRFVMAEAPQPLSDGLIPLVARPDRLPFGNNSMGCVVLHHALEPLSDPRDALREIARVLHPGGRLVIVAFNPWSALGLRRLWAKAGRDAFSPHRFVNPVRLLDWLGLLGLELEEPVRFRSTGLPFRIRRKPSAVAVEEDDDGCVLSEPVRRRHGIEIPLGDVFLVSAVKQAYYVRPKASTVRIADVKLAGVAYPKAGFSRQTARVIPVDFEGERR